MTKEAQALTDSLMVIPVARSGSTLARSNLERSKSAADTSSTTTRSMTETMGKRTRQTMQPSIWPSRFCCQALVKRLSRITRATSTVSRDCSSILPVCQLTSRHRRATSSYLLATKTTPIIGHCFRLPRKFRFAVEQDLVAPTGSR